MQKDIFKKKTDMHFCDKFQLSWLVLTLCLMLIFLAKSLVDGFENFSDSNCKKFNHLVVDKDRGWVFIGAVNRLYQLSLDLKLITNLTTGPMYNTDNYNKILVLDYDKSRLISCGSYSQGSCNMYEIENPLRKIINLAHPVVASSPSASTVAFIAPGTSRGKYRVWKKYSFPALYVGVTYRSNLVHQSKVPAVSTRFLEEEKFLQTIESGIFFTSDTQISFNDEFREKYIVNYVYGFSSGSYSYFLTTQMKSTESSSYISKLIRICQQDYYYNSYTEIPIECTDKFGKVHNLVQAAFITTPSYELAKSLGITTQNDVLFGVFSQSKRSVGTGTESNEPSNESALCVYSLKTINDKFTENIQHCYNGVGNRGLEHILSRSEKKCYKTSTGDLHFCGKIDNLPFGGNLPVRTIAVITFDTLLTAITAVSKSDFTLVIIGTHTGHLKQIAVKNTAAVWECNEIVIDEGSPVNLDLQFDPKNDHLYAMTKHKLTKIKIRDLLPSISNFKPKTGPWQGGTNVTIELDNFGNLSEGIHFDIEVAGIPCIPYKDHMSLRKIVCITKTSSASELREGPVTVLVNGVHVTSENNFKFVDFKIFNFFPKEGPTFGGTELFIEGNNLDSGKSVHVLIGNTSCAVFDRNSTLLKCITSPSPTVMEVNITVKIDNSTNMFSYPFNYTIDLNRDENGYNLVPKGIPAGGIVIVIRHEELKLSQKLMLRVYNENRTYDNSCKIRNSSIATCFSPRMSDINSSSINAESPKKLNCSLVTDDENSACINSSNIKYRQFLLYPNPVFKNFSVAEVDNSVFFIIKGQNIDKACQKTDFKVLVGNNTCGLFSLSQHRLICNILKNEIFDSRNLSDYEFVLPIYENITVQIGNDFTQIVYNENNMHNSGQSHFQTNDNSSFYLLQIEIFSLMVLMSLIVALCYVYRKKYSQSVSSKKMREQMNKLELRVATECKEAFAELQTEMTNFTAENLIDGLPFFNYRAYVMNNLFPEMENHSLFLNDTSVSIKRSDKLNLLDNLINNKTFLFIFIRTLENNENFSMKNRVYIASVLMITLQNNMDYCTDILETLLADLIAKYTKGKNHPKLLLRRTESVVEKMLSIWFTFLLYRFLRECAGEPLFKLFTAMKQHINKGPVDMITSDARYSLNQEKLFRHPINYHTTTVNINVSQQTADIIGLKSAMEMVSVTVLDCDTITQVKEKVLDVIFGTTGYSKYPNVFEFELKWMTGTLEGKILYDNDCSSKTEGEWKQKNTLLHYEVPNGAIFTLLSHKQMRHRTSSISSDEYFKEKPNINPCKSVKFHCVKKQISGSEISLIRNNEAYFKEWHLVKPDTPDNDNSDYYKDYKMVSEVYLTRVLGTKSTLQRFVDGLFKAILIRTHQIRCFPIAIKYMFDFLDDQAAQRGITDPEVVHTWKNNCLPLRFWVNLIKNPNFLFDVHKSNIIDSSLSVVAQAFMDSCSTADHCLGKDSPTSKLLYAKDIPFYKKWVKNYYADIRAMPTVSRKQMKTIFMEELLPHADDFNTDASIYELYTFMRLYKNELLVALREDKVSQKYSLASKLEEAIEMLDN